MKLPKGFGGQGFAGALQQAQQSMARVQNLEVELKKERIEIEKGPVKVVFDGTGEMQKITIDPSAVDPEDMEMLEDMIVAASRDGFTQATEMREARVKEIMPNVPGMDKLGL